LLSIEDRYFAWVTKKLLAVLGTPRPYRCVAHPTIALTIEPDSMITTASPPK